MKAQAAPMVPKPNQDPGTPVIIKIGGGGDDGAVVDINSAFMDWTDDTGLTWNDAWSTFASRIHGLTLREGQEPPASCEVQPEAEVLTTLKLYFESGDDTFEISEEQDGEGGIYLQAQSSNVLFQVTKFITSDQWTESKAVFPSNLVKVEFSQRKIGSTDDRMKFVYGVSSKDELNLSLNAQQS